MSVTDELLKSAEAYATEFDKGDLALPPARRVAVLACMDAQLDPQKVLGLAEGDGHVIRNAGGVATDDAIRSLAISQLLLGTDEIILIHHSDCGMCTFSDDDFRQGIEEETGLRPPWAAAAFPDAEGDLRRSVARIKASPFIPKRDHVRGFIYEEKTGRLREGAERGLPVVGVTVSSPPPAGSGALINAFCDPIASVSRSGAEGRRRSGT